MSKIKHAYILLFGIIFLVQSCSPAISPYDQYAYTQATSLKVDALNLMDNGTDSIQFHKKEIDIIESNMRKMYEYEKNRPQDTISTRQWRLMSDSTNNLFGGFMKKWRSEKVVSPFYIEEKKKQVAYNFDQIAELESKKIKPSQIKNN